MNYLHMLSLSLIGITWIAAWRVGQRWCVACGVSQRMSVLALACTVPTATLILAVHLMAYLALFSSRGLVSPAPVAAIFVLLTFAIDRWTRARTAGMAEALAPAHESLPPMSRLWCVPVLVVAGLYVVFLLDALTRYPTGYDGLKYHLPLAVGWMQQQQLDLVKGLMHQSLPENGMMVPFLLSFAKLERLLTIVHLPKALLLCATMYGLTRAIGVRREGAIAAVCIALTMPIVVFQSFSSYVDLYASSAWLCSLLALTWAHRARRVGRAYDLILFAGLWAGVAVGCKPTFLVLTAMLFAAVLCTRWIHGCASQRALIRPLRAAVVFSVAALVCSSFWFVRGAVQAGNPVYPISVAIGGYEILPGFDVRTNFPPRTAASRLAESWDYPWRETKFSGTGDPYSVNNALGAGYATFVPMGVLLAMVAVIGRSSRGLEERWQRVYLALALTGAALGLFATGWQTPRYVLPLILISVPLGAVLMDRLAALFPRSMPAMLAASLGVTAAIAMLSPVRSFLGRVRDGGWDRASFYEIPRMIDEWPAGTRVVNLGLPPMTYPLLGRELTNVAIPGVHWQLMCGGTKMSAAALIDQAIDYVYVREPWPRDWPDDLPLQKIHDDTHGRSRSTTPATRIYRVLRDVDESVLATVARSDELDLAGGENAHAQQ